MGSSSFSCLGISDQNEINKIMEESVKMKRFNHPNVMNLIGVCINAGPAPYIVMPFMANGSLLSYLRKERPNLLLDETADEDLVRAILHRHWFLLASHQWTYWRSSKQDCIFRSEDMYTVYGDISKQIFVNFYPTMWSQKVYASYMHHLCPRTCLCYCYTAGSYFHRYN